MTGGSLPAEIWRKFMQAATEGVDTGTFHEPDLVPGPGPATSVLEHDHHHRTDVVDELHHARRARPPTTVEDTTTSSSTTHLDHDDDVAHHHDASPGQLTAPRHRARPAQMVWCG